MLLPWTIQLQLQRGSAGTNIRGIVAEGVCRFKYQGCSYRGGLQVQILGVQLQRGSTGTNIRGIVTEGVCRQKYQGYSYRGGLQVEILGVQLQRGPAGRNIWGIFTEWVCRQKYLGYIYRVGLQVVLPVNKKVLQGLVMFLTRPPVKSLTCGDKFFSLINKAQACSKWLSSAILFQQHFLFVTSNSVISRFPTTTSSDKMMN